MSAPSANPISLLIAALGGEGGGVLTSWIVNGAQAEGLIVQATSIPGVAQRTGATTYYIEIWPEKNSGLRPVLALSPAPGEVDIVATTELLEAGRAIVNGMVTPGRTHLIASTHRVFTTFEKMASGDGRFDENKIISAAKSRAKSTTLIDMHEISEENSSHISAVMLGLLAASNKLPISPKALRAAIEHGGKAVKANLRGFDAGLVASVGTAKEITNLDNRHLISIALDKLRIYQDEEYAELFLKRLRTFNGAPAELLGQIIKGLVRRMAYNDIIAVAKIKTRPGRIESFANTSGEGDIVRLSEYFRPGISEIADILPSIIGRAISRWAKSKNRSFRFSWPLVLRSNSIIGFLALRTLCALRPLRRISYRYREEQGEIDAWLAEIARAMEINQSLAMEIALNSQIIKGYGHTHSHSRGAYSSIRSGYVVPALEGEAVSPEQISEARERVFSDRSN